MTDEVLAGSIVDQDRLRLLSIGYKISSGIAALFSLFGLLYVFFGIVMSGAFRHVSQASFNPSGPPPAFVGFIFAAMGLGMFAIMVVIAILKYRVAVSIDRRKSRTFCMVIAAIGCLEFPYGIVLGVFTFMLLSRDSVRPLFQPAKQTASNEAGGGALTAAK